MIDEEALRSIEKLHELKVAGIISEADFEKAKTDLLQGRARSTSRRTGAPTTTPDNELPSAEDYYAWAVLPLKRYADFDGRSTRKEFWLFTLMINILVAVLAIVAGMDSDGFGEMGALGRLLIGVMLLGILGVALPVIAAQVRRFHDQDKPGWFALLNLVPYIGPFIVLGFMTVDGTPGENRFGPDPKER